MLRFTGLTVAMLLALTCGVSAQEAYTLKLYKSKVGDQLKVSKSKTEGGTLKIEFGGMTRNEELAGGEKTVYTQEILAKPDGAKKPTKLKRTYEIAQKIEKKETVKQPFHGETVTIEKVGDKYEFTMNGKKMNAADAVELDKEFNKKSEGPTNDEMLSDKPVKVGESWDVDVKKAIESLNDDGKLTISEKGSSIKGKLLKAEKKDGVLFGTIEFTIVLVVEKMAFGPGESLPLKDGSKMKLVVAVETCLDGKVPGEKSDMTMLMTMEAGLPNNGKLVIDGKTTGTDSETPVKK